MTMQHSSIHTDMPVNPNGREISGRTVLIGFICFFGLITIVNLTMAYFASQSWTGLVVRNSYVASQEFNGKAEDARVQAALGWLDDLTYQDGNIRLTLTDNTGQPVALSSVLVKLGRPATERDDRVLELVRQDDHSFVVAEKLAPGQWQATVMAVTDNAKEWIMHYRFSVAHEN